MNKNYYAGSFDPPHLGHYNTFLKAKKVLNEEVAIAICHNELKNGRFLTMTERRKMCELTFGTQDIRICQNRDEMVALIKESKRIIRGVGRKDDLVDISRILQYYKFENVEEKFLLLEIDEEFINTSSSSIRQQLLVNKPNSDLLNMKIHPEVYRLLLKKKEEVIFN